jgi:hypothetical protein
MNNSFELPANEERKVLGSNLVNQLNAPMSSRLNPNAAPFKPQPVLNPNAAPFKPQPVLNPNAAPFTPASQPRPWYKSWTNAVKSSLPTTGGKRKSLRKNRKNRKNTRKNRL